MKTILVVAVASLVSLALGQKLPEFEVASLKPSAANADMRVNLGYHIDGSLVTCSHVSLKELVRMAYDVKDYQIVAPEWTATDRYDLAAKLPEGSKPDQIRDMVKSLLADRFHMKLHKDTKEFPVYALVVGKNGPQLKESAPLEAADAPARPATNITASGGPEGVSVNLGEGASFTFADNKVEGKRLTMPRFAEMLGRFVDRPVVDMTGLPGAYDFTLKVSDEDFNAMRIRSAISAGVVLPPQAMRLLEISSGDSLASGLQGLGLKLDPRKAPLEVVVVDQADKTPTAN
jgi:uncharacterized protein (TIGR03435 family)